MTSAPSAACTDQSFVGFRRHRDAALVERRHARLAAEGLDHVPEEERLGRGEHERDRQRDPRDRVELRRQHRPAPRGAVEPLDEPEAEEEHAPDERRPHVHPRELLAVERLPGELGQQGIGGAEDQQADVQHRHVMEVTDDPERVVHCHVQRDRRVDDAREPGEEPADEAEEERRRRGCPAEPRSVDREGEAVERERGGQHERERDRLHRRVDLRLRRTARIVEVEVVREDEDVRDHGDRPRNGDHVARDEVAAGVARNQEVVDGHRGEQQEVDDRVAEPPEDVLGKQVVRRADDVHRLQDLPDEQPGERKRGDDHVEPDHRERDHRVRHGLRVRGERAGHHEAPAEREAEPLADRARDAVERLTVRHRVEDREAPGHDCEPREQDGEGEEAGRPVAPVAAAVERQRVEEDPGGGEAHEEGRDDHAGDAEHHQPPRDARHRESEAPHREADTGEDPEGEAHHRERAPADERSEAVGRHHRVPEVVSDAGLRHGLAPPQHDAEQAGRSKDHGRGDDVADRQSPGDAERAVVHHAGATSNFDTIV